MVLDTIEDKQSYVEDCEVCCRPLLIRYRVEGQGDEVVGFGAEPS